MAFLKFNKAELVNLSYSLKREIILANKTGAYCNTSIVTCNTRRYHGLLAVPVDEFGGGQYLLLSSLDESLVIDDKRFNLGIHRYGTIYEPRGHKYIVDFKADPVPEITYKVGAVVLTKSILLVPNSDQVLISYHLEKSPSKLDLELKPFLAFRSVNSLTRKNDEAVLDYREIRNGVAFNMYQGFPDLNLQLNTSSASFVSEPHWYEGVTYSDEYRRGFDCVEDLFVPGHFSLRMKEGDTVIFSASVNEVAPAGMKRVFSSGVEKAGIIEDYHDQLVRCADLLKRDRGGKKQITAGFSWLYTGLLRETLYSLPGLTLYADGNMEEFEEILDNLIADNEERFYRRTTQIEAPLRLADVLQQYIEFGADPGRVWKKYGPVVRGVIESYAPGCRKEAALQPNGLIWAQAERVALSWMNAYANGFPVTERAGYQVETNALWYNTLCFAIEMEGRFPGKGSKAFADRWTPVRDAAKATFQPMFWCDVKNCLADYVDGAGQNTDVRCNQLYAVWLPYSMVDDEHMAKIVKVVRDELLTSRGVRTLSPRNPKYRGVYEGSQIERDLAYHQGCTRLYPLYQYIEVMFRMRGAAFMKKAEWLCEGFYDDLNKHGVGAFSEVYDGDPPHEPHGAIFSAVSTAALLGIGYVMEKYMEE